LGTSWDGCGHSPQGLTVDGSKSSCLQIRCPPAGPLQNEAMGDTANMNTPSNIILAEIGDVAKIVRVACAVESVQRGTLVSPHDPRVQARAADIILNGAGAHLREVHNRERSSN
jgi:hypothetical protein